jgi:HNH endonuclease
VPPGEKHFYARLFVLPGVVWLVVAIVLQAAEVGDAAVSIALAPATLCMLYLFVSALRREPELFKRFARERSEWPIQARAAASAQRVGRVRIPNDVKREVWRRDRGRCVECGSRTRLEYDHIIPVTRGGSNTVRNVELLCESCNRRKGARI